MASHAVSGKLYVGSITDVTGTSGTLIGEIDGRVIDIVATKRMILKRTGRKADQIGAIYAGLSSTFLILRGRDISNDTFNLIYQDLASSGDVKSDRSNMNVKAATQAFIIRPGTATQRYFYAPKMVHDTGNTMRAKYGVRETLLNENEITFFPSRDGGDTEPAWMLASSSAVISAYSALS